MAPVTDPAAVESALREFDALGRQGFLDKYGFGPARRYFLVEGDRHYDSKAVLGAAHGYQHGVPLRHQEFSGGDIGAAQDLRRLGFEVVAVEVDVAFDSSTPSPAGGLKLWERYSREQVHDIFAPDTPFTPRAGTWGFQGIVPVPGRKGDFVFFVTYGMRQGDHSFDESITVDGVLTWQSQPRQDLRSPQIQTLISHDEGVNTIHLFLRKSVGGGMPYTYFGPLAYLGHDMERERPVYFKWQILEWPPAPGVLKRAGLSLAASPEVSSPDHRNVLEKSDPPVAKRRGGQTTRRFRGDRQPSYADRDAQNADLGLSGELLVLEYERARLKAMDRADLAERVVHVSVIEGDSAGYDIRSFEIDETPRYIEVKTTRGAASTGFFVSANQVAFSKANAARFVLVRVYNYDPERNSGRFFELWGPLDSSFELIPTEFRATIPRGEEDDDSGQGKALGTP